MKKTKNPSEKADEDILPLSDVVPKETPKPKDRQPVVLTDLEIARKLVSLEHSAQSRSLEFNLKFATVKRLLTQKSCYFTGVQLTDAGPTQRSIDRLDNSRGYVEGNVVACTVEINRKKGMLSVAEIRDLYTGLKRAGRV